ncbi:MAG: DUF3105 domain-containing protein [Candidatus Limnocylindria bacterium]
MTTRRRRTSGIQRRERASSEAMTRRLDDGGPAAGLPDWRLLAIGGLLIVGILVVVMVLIFGSAPSANAGVQQANDGQGHTAIGADCRDPGQQNDSTNCGTDPYSSLPAASGPHWDPSGIANWGVYSTPQSETQLIHNLEHGGIVIWYDPGLDGEQVADLASYVDAQTSQGVAGRYKFILTPWGGEQALPAPVVATAWRWLLELDTADTAAIDEFARDHYGQAPEPNGGPGPPG